VRRELPDLDCTSTVLHAYDVVTIITAMVEPSTLLCMSTHGRGGVARAALGSTTEAVLHVIRNPVLVVGPRVVEDPKPGLVQACIDPRSVASHRAAAIALELAAWVGDRLTLVEVQPIVAMPLTDGVADAAALEWIAAGLDDGRVPIDCEVIHGDDVVEELVVSSRERGVQMLASATHGRAGLARAVLGSVAAGLVREATCPVLVVPPRMSG
jgi:nucleotide-binding universal stress UspA family protein